jgi:hypothetical protein
VRSRLSRAEWDAFCEQAVADQRHGYSAGRAVEETLASSPGAVRAALLHDIGKRHAGLGLAGRTLASVAIRIGLPLWEGARTYRDHGMIGSRELAAWGAEPLVVEFALFHHGTCPPTIETDLWQVLVEGDKPQK